MVRIDNSPGCLTRIHCADIAVDGMFLTSPTLCTHARRSGWALTLLSEENLSYASTCQTIGLNTGFFASFTVFLALNSDAFRYVHAMIIPPRLFDPSLLFSERWGIPVLSLSTYLRFWSVICFGVTIWLMFFQKEV